jgi:hypothetical protein
VAKAVTRVVVVVLVLPLPLAAAAASARGGMKAGASSRFSILRNLGYLYIGIFT